MPYNLQVSAEFDCTELQQAPQLMSAHLNDSMLTWLDLNSLFPWTRFILHNLCCLNCLIIFSQSLWLYFFSLFETTFLPRSGYTWMPWSIYSYFSIWCVCSLYFRLIRTALSPNSVVQPSIGNFCSFSTKQLAQLGLHVLSTPLIFSTHVAVYFHFKSRKLLQSDNSSKTFVYNWESMIFWFYFIQYWVIKIK